MAVQSRLDRFYGNNLDKPPSRANELRAYQPGILQMGGGFNGTIKFVCHFLCQLKFLPRSILKMASASSIDLETDKMG